MASRDRRATFVDPRVELEAGYTGLQRRFLELVIEERWFLLLLCAGFTLAGATYATPSVAMWVGFLFAGYAVVANDSIQTIGTFIASNKQRPWWLLWLFIGGLMVATLSWSWVANSGDVSFHRLSAKGFETAPTQFAFLQIAGPLFLLIMTRLRMPVSTTFLLLTSFATSTDGVGKVLEKSVIGYGLAFVVAISVWLLAGRLMHDRFKGEAHPIWNLAQWCSTSVLWVMWLVQDAANVAVFLPRQLEFGQFLVFVGVLFAGLGVLFKLGGDKIQQVVDEKSAVVDVRHATVIDAVYAVILLVFTVWSHVPMSTTWVFIGLLAGREIGIHVTRAKAERRTRQELVRLVLRDLIMVWIGLCVSLFIAVLVNPGLKASLFGL
ncbi:hypothetical protein ACNOYE_26730 [Nannocystaceae bacterium ST9]